MEKSFISMSDKNKKGYGAEKKVWDAVENAFSARECFAYWNYPIFHSDYDSRKEPDILLFDKELGITIIEVKGIRIDNIEFIQGHEWSYLNYFVEKVIPINKQNIKCMLCQNGILKYIINSRNVSWWPYRT